MYFSKRKECWYGTVQQKWTEDDKKKLTEPKRTIICMSQIIEGNKKDFD